MDLLQDLLAMLAEVYGGANNNSGNGYMYHYLLDEMMRRGQIGVSAAAKVRLLCISFSYVFWNRYSPS